MAALYSDKGYISDIEGGIYWGSRYGLCKEFITFAFPY